MIATQGFDTNQRIVTFGFGGVLAAPAVSDAMIVSQGFDNNQRIATSGFGGTPAVTAPLSPISRYGGFIPSAYTKLDDDAELLVLMYWKHREAKA